VGCRCWGSFLVRVFRWGDFGKWDSKGVFRGEAATSWSELLCRCEHTMFSTRRIALGYCIYRQSIYENAEGLTLDEVEILHNVFDNTARRSKIRGLSDFNSMSPL
jgi:hypothetical protein